MSQFKYYYTACPSFRNSPVLVLFTPKHSDYPLPLFLPSYPGAARPGCLLLPQKSSDIIYEHIEWTNQWGPTAAWGNKSSQS